MASDLLWFDLRWNFTFVYHKHIIFRVIISKSLTHIRQPIYYCNHIKKKDDVNNIITPKMINLRIFFSTPNRRRKKTTTTEWRKCISRNFRLLTVCGNEMSIRQKCMCWMHFYVTKVTTKIVRQRQIDRVKGNERKRE